MMKASIITLFVAIIRSDMSTAEKGRRFEVENCEEIIPQFIDHISEHGDGGECGQVGQFPKPGDCTVFFKCVRGRGRILPILEYCAIGYNFDGHSCVRSSDLTDCPQFNCKMINDTDLHKDEAMRPHIITAVPENSSVNITKMPREMSNSHSTESDKLQNEIALSAAQKATEIDHSSNTGPTFKKIDPFGLFLVVCAFNKML